MQQDLSIYTHDPEADKQAIEPLKRKLLQNSSPANLRQTPRRSLKAQEAASSKTPKEKQTNNSYFKCVLCCLKQFLKSPVQIPVVLKGILQDVSVEKNVSTSTNVTTDISAAKESSKAENKEKDLESISRTEHEIDFNRTPSQKAEG